MGKVKKHSGLSKVLKKRSNGTITLRHSGLNHKTGKTKGKYNRKKRKNASLSRADARRLKKVI